MAADLNDGDMVETLLGQKLLVHLHDGMVMFGEAMVTATDLEAGNGVVHVINKVLMPSTLPATLVDIALGSSDHTVLVELLTAANLVDVLAGDGPFTVFAPTDAAFEDAGLTASDLTVRTDLADILKYHVVSGKVSSPQLPLPNEHIVLLLSYPGPSGVGLSSSQCLATM